VGESTSAGKRDEIDDCHWTDESGDEMKQRPEDLNLPIWLAWLVRVTGADRVRDREWH
jgi:hypothetical protein